MIYGMTVLAKADSSNITIIEPANDNPVYNSDFPVVISVTDTNVRTVQVRATGYPWITLDQATNTDWSGIFPISDYSNGNYQLTAKYLKNGESIPYYVANTIAFTINHPEVILDIIVRDQQNNTLEGVVISPGGNTTNSLGKITVRGLALNTLYQFNFNKSGYLDSTLQYTPASYTASRTVTLEKKNSTSLRKFRITGYSSMAEINTMFNLRIRDEETDKAVEGATVLIYQGPRVISMPGVTSSTGRITASFIQDGEFDLTVEKDGYEEWSQSVTVIAPRTTPTPTPIPTLAATPVPTPVKRACSDTGLSLTDDECRQLLSKLEQERAQAKANNTPVPALTYSPPVQPTKDTFPWGLIGIVGLVAGGAIYSQINKKGKSQEQDDILDHKDHDPESFTTKVKDTVFKPGSKAKTAMIGCELCEWTKEVPASLSDDEKSALIDVHKNKEHAE